MDSGIIVSSVDLRPSLMSVLKGLSDTPLLKRVVTTLAIDPGSALGRLTRSFARVLPRKLQMSVDRKVLPDFLRGRIDLVFSREICRLAAKGFGNEIMAHRLWQWAELGFDREVARRYAGSYSCIFGMEHSSSETFIRQKESGGLCILRQVMAHGRYAENVMRCQINKFPQYSNAYTAILLEEGDTFLARKENEYRLADLILANSSFVKDTFIRSGVYADKIEVIPTGCPVNYRAPANSGRGNQPLVFLFAGRLSLRKGLPYLMEAWDMLKPEGTAELWLVGEKEIPGNIFEGRKSGIRVFGALAPSRLAEAYSRADVFVFPTLLEGLAYVVLEALSSGLPVITTVESGASNFVVNGENGFVIDSANTASLYQSMAWCLDHRDQLSVMGRNSLQKAQAWTIDDSSRKHLEVITEFLKNHER